MRVRSPRHLLPTIFLAIVQPALLCMAGCYLIPTRMYDGPKRPKEEVSVVQALSSRILAFDGREFDGWNEPTSVEALPGAHTMTVRTQWDNYFKENLTLSFTGEAGHEYSVERWDNHDRGSHYRFAEDMAHLPLFGAIPMAYMIGHEAASNPVGPPTEAYLWIEDDETLKIVGGTPPPVWSVGWKVIETVRKYRERTLVEKQH